MYVLNWVLPLSNFLTLRYAKEKWKFLVLRPLVLGVHCGTKNNPLTRNLIIPKISVCVNYFPTSKNGGILATVFFNLVFFEADIPFSLGGTLSNIFMKATFLQYFKTSVNMVILKKLLSNLLYYI